MMVLFCASSTGSLLKSSPTLFRKTTLLGDSTTHGQHITCSATEIEVVYSFLSLILPSSPWCSRFHSNISNIIPPNVVITPR